MASPRCTVVVVALHGGRNLEACLEQLGAQGAACVVMLGPNMDAAAVWRDRFPSVRFVDAAALPVPWRRRRGIEAADGEWVALLEDSSLPQARWSEAIAEAFGAPAVAAVGGPVAIGTGVSYRQAALACCEYGRFHPSAIRRLASGGEATRSGAFDVERLPGNNVAYRKSALRLVCPEEEPLLETQANAALLAAGRRLQVHPDMAVEYRPADNHGARLAERFRHGRLYGGMRARGASVGARIGWLFKALLLPFVLSGRGLRAMRVALPPRAWCAVGAWVWCMETAWAAGEAAGYVAGPGRTLEGWR